MENTFRKTRITFMLVCFCLLGLNAMAQDTNEKKTPTEEELKAYVGQYNFDPADGRGFSITISMTNGNLMAQPTDKSQPITGLVYSSEDYFELNINAPLSIRFNRNDKKEIESLTFSDGTNSFSAKREN